MVAPSSINPPSRKLKRLTIVGIVLSTLYLIVWGIVLLNTWPDVKNMALNNWGDFFAGVMAPLALLWLVLGYFQQSEELRQNTDALRLQADQLRNQVEETRLLVQEASSQAKASADLVALQTAHAVREERRALPEFSELKLERSDAAGVILSLSNEIRVQFRSVGGRITHLKMAVLPPGIKQCSYPEHFLEPSQYCAINMKFEKQPPRDFTFDLTYTDAVGVRRLSRFSVEGEAINLITHAAALPH